MAIPIKFLGPPVLSGFEYLSVASQRVMVLSEIIVAVTVAYLGPKRSYRLILKGERYVLHRSWLRDWLCQRRRESIPTRPTACAFPQCQCFPHWFVRRIFHGVFNFAKRLRWRERTRELSAEHRNSGKGMHVQQLPREDSTEIPSSRTKK
jgi:hypothetical protein